MLNFRSPPELTGRIDAWAAEQPPPKPTRSEAIRRLLEERLSQQAGRQSDVSLDRQIAEQKTAIAEMPEHSEPSPEAGLAAMDKAVAENDLIDMKNKRTRRKNAKRA
jgi:hypothetical protein